MLCEKERGSKERRKQPGESVGFHRFPSKTRWSVFFSRQKKGLSFPALLPELERGVLAARQAGDPLLKYGPLHIPVHEPLRPAARDWLLP